MRPWIEDLNRGTREFSGVLASGDLTAAVPACPGWTLADLAGHVGGIYQWAAHAITEGTPDAQLEPAPVGRASLVDWYDGQAGRLIDLLSNLPPDVPAWTFGPRPRTVAFWARRQAHETRMHLWDAMQSQGGLHQIDCRSALDGLDEVFIVFFPRQVRLGRTLPLSHPVALIPDDDAGRGDGFVVSRDRFVFSGDGAGPAATADPAASISGPADALLLLLWKRIGLDDVRLRVSGDAAIAAAFWNAKLTP